MSKELSDSKLFIFFDRTFVNFDRDLAHAYEKVQALMTYKCTSFKGLSINLAKCPFLFYANQN